MEVYWQILHCRPCAISTNNSCDIQSLWFWHGSSIAKPLEYFLFVFSACFSIAKPGKHFLIETDDGDGPGQIWHKDYEHPPKIGVTDISESRYINLYQIIGKIIVINKLNLEIINNSIDFGICINLGPINTLKSYFFVKIKFNDYVAYLTILST